MNTTYIDTHAHLNDERFADDLATVVAHAAEAGLERVITIGIDVATSRENIALAERYPLLRSAVGIQPNHVAEALAGDWERIVQLAEHPTCVAIGETGLDRYWDRAPFDLQEDYFARHLALARTTHKPVIIHCREAEADVARMLRMAYEAYGPIAGVMHSYTGDTATAQQCIDMGLYVSFAGMVTYKNAEAIRATARMIPRERLLIETDSPYLAPVPKRGQRNEPAYVVHTAAVLAEVQGIALAELADRTTRNAKQLFGI